MKFILSLFFLFIPFILHAEYTINNSTYSINTNIEVSSYSHINTEILVSTTAVQGN